MARIPSAGGVTEDADRLATTDPITFAVDGVSGTDSPSVNRPEVITEGDFTAYPFQTIQAALDTIPKFLNHACVINVIAADSYVGFSMAGFFGSGGLTINGLQDQVTPVTGPATGTATSGTAATLTLTGAGWTVDNFVGKFCRITGGTGAGQSFIIASNTATVLTFVGRMSPAPDGTSVFEITEPTTVIDTNASSFPAGIYHSVCLGSFEVNDFHIEGPSNGLVQLNTRSVLTLNRVTQMGGFYGFVGQDSFKAAWNQIGSLGSSSVGIWFLNMGFAGNPSNEKGWLAIDAAGGADGIRFTSCVLGGCQGVYVKNCANNGIQLTESEINLRYVQADDNVDGIWCSNSHLYLNDASASNNSKRGIGCAYGGRVDSLGSLAGAGNTEWGVHPGAGLGEGGWFTIEAVPTITGTLGDVTVDGTNALVWATDLAAVGDYSQNYPNQAHLLRTA